MSVKLFKAPEVQANHPILSQINICKGEMGSKAARHPLIAVIDIPLLHPQEHKEVSNLLICGLAFERFLLHDNKGKKWTICLIDAAKDLLP